MVGLSEVRRNLEEWKPSMVEEYGALVVEPEAVEPISRERMKEMKEEAARLRERPSTCSPRRRSSAERLGRADINAEESLVGTT